MRIRIALGVTVMLATVIGVSACSNPTGKSWAVTYELSDNSGSTLSQVSYTNSPDRYDDKVTRHAVTGPVGTPWKQEVIISAGQQAEVTANPTGNSTLTCRILLDGTKELATATASAAGMPVTCAHVTDK